MNEKNINIVSTSEIVSKLISDVGLKFNQRNFMSFGLLEVVKNFNLS